MDQTKKRKVKRVFLVSDEAMRRCAEAGLRVTMPSPGNPEIAYVFELLDGGQLQIAVTKTGVTTRFLIPATAYIAELA